jgi:hypothetical protein
MVSSDIEPYGYSGIGLVGFLRIGFFQEDIGFDRDVKMHKYAPRSFHFSCFAFILRRLVIISGFSAKEVPQRT